MSQWKFRDELQLMEINVPRAALQLARTIAYPDLNVAQYMSRLHELSEEGADAIDMNLPVALQVEQLSEFLFVKSGFRGDQSDYQNPLNSFLNEVIDRRVGIPLTLSILYIDIATRLGIPAYGIGLPGHFIVGIHDKEADIWLDPFHGGRVLDLADCVDLIYLSTGYEGPLEASWFEPFPALAILARMLANLRAGYVGSRAWPQAAQAIQLLRQVQPAEPEHLRDLGLVFYHKRNLPQAAYYLNYYLQRKPGAGDAQVIREGIKHILDEWVPMN